MGVCEVMVSPEVKVTAGGIHYVGQLVGDASVFTPAPQHVSTPIPSSAYEIDPGQIAVIRMLIMYRVRQ